MKIRRQALWKEAAAYLAAAVGSLAAATFTLGLSGADLRVPFAYDADALATSAQIKNLIENGGLATNPSIGMPDGASFFDFPGADGVHVAVLRLVASFTRDYGLAMNLFYLLGFVLVAVASVAALRALKVSRVPAVAISVLYAALPYHFWRGEWHLFLSAYWAVPLAVLVFVWLAREEPLLFQPGSWRPRLRDTRTLAALGICLVLGESGIYYAFFTAFLLLVAGVYATVRRSDPRRLVAAAALVIAVCVSLAVGLVPSMIEGAKAGPNPEAAKRWPGETEVYSLRIPQLVLPVTGHRIRQLDVVKARYHEVLQVLTPAADNENDSSALGLIFAAGFLALIAAAVWPHPSQHDTDVGTLAVLNLAAVLFATVAGFDLLFAMFVTPQLRAYNRISVFVAFFAAAFVAIVLERFRDRYASAGAARVAFVAGCVLLVALGVFDQSSLAYRGHYDATEAAFAADAAFVSRVEAELPNDAMVFQLPYMPYPESPPVEQLNDYEHLRAYLHSTHTRWSYGAMKGRNTDLWQRRVAGLPTAEFLTEIEAAGFDGVWVDTRGYADKGARVVGQIERETGTDALESDDGRVAFIPLRAE